MGRAEMFPEAWTIWDRTIARRAATLTLLSFALALLVGAATDEGGVPWSERVARILPLAPPLSALGAWLSGAGARRRGERKALEALGRPPWRNARAEALGAAWIGVLASAGCFALGVRAFFPVLAASGPYRFDGEAFTNLATGWKVMMADGTIVLPPLVQGGALRGAPAHAMVAAALSTAAGSLAFPMVLALTRKDESRRALALLAVTAFASVLAFQASAAGRLPAMFASLPTVGLLAGVVWVIVRSR